MNDLREEEIGTSSQRCSNESLSCNGLEETAFLPKEGLNRQTTYRSLQRSLWSICDISKRNTYFRRPASFRVGFLVSIAFLSLLYTLSGTHQNRFSIWDSQLAELRADHLIKLAPISKTYSPYGRSRFNGLSDLEMFSKPDQKIVGFVLAGRKEFVQILNCYVERNLVRNGGWLDEVLWIIRTDEESDIEYLEDLIAKTPEYSGHRFPRSKAPSQYKEIYSLCERGALYIKIDDDVVFWEDHTIPAIVKRKVENPQFSVVSANIMNQPALSWVHYHLNTAKAYLPEMSKPEDFIEEDWTRHYSVDWRASKLPRQTGKEIFEFNERNAAPFKGHRWLPLGPEADLEKTPIGILGEGASHEYAWNSSGWHSWAIAAQEHYSFLENLENDELWRYKFDLWHYHYDRISINFLAFSGDDIQDHPIEGGDERYLTMKLPKRLKRPAVLDGTAMAVHFGFHRQVYGHGGRPGSALNDTDLLSRYHSYAREFICGKPMGSPRL